MLNILKIVLLEKYSWRQKQDHSLPEQISKGQQKTKTKVCFDYIIIHAYSSYLFLLGCNDFVGSCSKLTALLHVYNYILAALANQSRSRSWRGSGSSRRCTDWAVYKPWLRLNLLWWLKTRISPRFEETCAALIWWAEQWSHPNPWKLVTMLPYKAKGILLMRLRSCDAKINLDYWAGPMYSQGS